MIRVALKRIIRAGYLSFRRNGWLSTATIMVMSMVLFVLGNLVFLGAMAATLLSSLEEKIDISIYLHRDAPEDNILAVKKDVETIPEVAEVSYISRDKALTLFRARHQNNALIAGALEELGDNPLQGSLNVRAKDPTQYAFINDLLLKKNYPIVDKINYSENQAVIEKLGVILKTTRGSGALLALFLSFVAVLVAFNTIRLAIYTMREEIGIMRLVGAAQWFIRGPFLVSGVFYGAIAALVTTLIFFPLTWFASPKINLLIPNFDLFQYFLANFLEFFIVMFFVGIILGMASSLIAIRRYLRI